MRGRQRDTSSVVAPHRATDPTIGLMSTSPRTLTRPGTPAVPRPRSNENAETATTFGYDCLSCGEGNDKCHVVVEFPTDSLPIIAEYQATAAAAAHFTEVVEAAHIAHVHIDHHLSPGLPEMPCERLWTQPVPHRALGTETPLHPDKTASRERKTVKQNYSPTTADGAAVGAMHYQGFGGWA